jgi:hypothetical protein
MARQRDIIETYEKGELIVFVVFAIAVVVLVAMVYAWR